MNNNGFNNPFMSGFNPYGMNPYQNGMMNQPNTNQGEHIVQVEGEQGVRDAYMPPNSEKFFLDASGKLIWLAKTDNYGMKTLIAPYDINPHKTQEATQLDDLSERMAKLEEVLHEFLAPANPTATTGASKPSAEPLYATTDAKSNKANG